MKPSASAEAAGAHHGIAQRHCPVMLEQHERGGRVVRDLVNDVPRVLVVEDLDALGGRLGARLGAGREAFLALDAEADERADLAAELDRLVL